jgi:murein DD-endopeptidase MepM/ murein hydrolase activator NlpD
MNRETFRRWIAQLNRIYRVSFVDDETLHETRRYIIKPKTLLVSSILLVLGIIITTASLIIFTPAIREQIPGYLDPEYKVRQNEMLAKIAELQQHIEERDSSIAVFKSVLDGMGGVEKLNLNVPPKNEPSKPQAVKPASEPIKPDSRPVARMVRDEQTRPVMLSLYLPVEGKLRNPFNHSTGHYGVDIAARDKAFVRAATDGTVIFSEYSDRDGHVIGITSSNDVVTFYKHNSKLLKGVGEAVRAGEVVAVVGNSGENTNGPHLHFEVWRKGVAVDPLAYFTEWQ